MTSAPDRGGTSLRGALVNGGDTTVFDKLAGRAVMMLFLGKSDRPTTPAAIALLNGHSKLFDGERAAFVGITLDSAEGIGSLDIPQGPGHTWLQDVNGGLAKRFGLLTKDDSGNYRYPPCWIVVDIRLRVIDYAPIADGERMFGVLRDYIATGEQHAVDMPAPVLVAPRVFEPELCRRLIDIFEREGGQQSGFIHLIDGKPGRSIDDSIKRRSDFYITDPGLRAELICRLKTSLFPLIKRAFQFKVTQVERLNIVCYDGEEGGFFRAHRDDRTVATAHRRFACTINLNADFDGGDLRFPEFGVRTYRAPPGGAAVFSCVLLHEALPVTRGKRYALLPFLFDDEGAVQLKAYQATIAQQQ